MRITKKQLIKIIGESAYLAKPVPPEILSGYIGMIRAMQLWFQSAHNLTKGPGFAGDHVNLYGKIYTDLQDEYDAAVEKAIGITGDEGIGCPKHVTSVALGILGRYPSPAGMSSLDIAKAASGMVNDYIDTITDLFYTLEEMGSLPLGLNDFLAASANTHESYAYLLSQRIKGVFHGE